MNNGSILTRLSGMLLNEENVYAEKNLNRYYRVQFFRSGNNGYHNLQHFFRVFSHLYDAGKFYLLREKLNRREIRNLLIAGLMHDWDHPGTKPEDDSVNIELAIAGLREHIEDCDRQHLPDIERLIWATRYPHLLDIEIDLRAQLIREADVAQALDDEWLQLVVCGLATEWNMRRTDIMVMQPRFLESLRTAFQSEWAQQTLLPLVGPKLADVSALVAIMTEYDQDPMARPKSLEEATNHRFPGA